MAVIMGNTSNNNTNGWWLVYQTPAGVPCDIVLTALPSATPGNAVSLAATSTPSGGTYPVAYTSYNLVQGQTITLRQFQGAIYANTNGDPGLSWIITNRA